MHKSFNLLRNNSNNELVKKNIIFLDIDGVIQPYDNQYRFLHDMKETINYLCKKYQTEIYRNMDIYDVCAAYYDWDEIAIGMLTKILRITDSYVVIHSGWKEYNNLDQMKALFALYNLEDYIIGICEKGDKIKVINKYLENHKDEINEYIVIDDEDMTSSFGHHFVKTRNYLTSKNYEQCIKLLRYKYSFNLNDDLTVLRKDIPIIYVESRPEIIEDKIVFYVEFRNLSNNISDIEYFITLNYLIKYFKELSDDNFGVVFIGDVRKQEFDYIKKSCYFNRQRSEYEYMFYFSLVNRGFEGTKFFNENHGLIAEKL